jgi:hypothetical protein
MSTQEQDIVIGRLVREYSDRKRTLAVWPARLARIGGMLQTIGAKLQTLKPDAYEATADEIASQLSTALQDVDVSALLDMVREYARLNEEMARDRQLLKNYGVEC